MQSGRRETEFLVSCYHTPSETVRRIFNVVLRAGHLRAAPDYRIERRHLPGHDLLFCLRGSGFILSADRRYQVREDELAWISGATGAARDWDVFVTETLASITPHLETTELRRALGQLKARASRMRALQRAAIGEAAASQRLARLLLALGALRRRSGPAR